MSADLALVINLDQPIPSLRNVRSVSDLTVAALPPLPAGTVLSGELRLIDGSGARWASYLDGTWSPRLRVWVPGPTGIVQLVLVTAMTPLLVSSVQVGWSFALPLTGQLLLDYVQPAEDSRDCRFELSIYGADGSSKLLYLVDGTIAATSLVTPPISQTAEIRPDINSAALLKAVSTVGHVLPWLVITLEPGWTAWTLRARTVSDPSNATIAANDPAGDTWRVPNDADPSTNNVIWVRSAIS